MFFFICTHHLIETQFVVLYTHPDDRATVSQHAVVLPNSAAFCETWTEEKLQYYQRAASDPG